MTVSCKFRDLTFFVLTLSLALVLCTVYGRADTEGDTWLGMSPEAQVVFVRGYIAGLTHGFEEGCDAYRTIDPRKNYDLHHDRFAKCLNRSPGFSKPVEYYARQVAAFYASFPSDRTVPFETVVSKVSESENMTTQQMHEWFKSQRK